MTSIPKTNYVFVAIISLILMLPVFYIINQYEGVYPVVSTILGTLGLVLSLVLLFILTKSLNSTFAKSLVILLFFLFLLTRIILSFVYDFSGRGFTSEFFAHFSWDSFVIGLDEYGLLLYVCVIGALFIGWLLAKLLKSNEDKILTSIVLLLAVSASLMFFNKKNIPEYRLLKAYQKYTDVKVETKDIEAIREETIGTLKPIRQTETIPPNKDDIKATLPEQPKNLILIYLESFSDILTDNPQYPGLTPNLDQLKKQHFSFENYYSGGYVTIEGIANSQCGTLMNMDSGNNSLTSSVGRLTNLPCLGDVLNKAGYYQVFMGGADLEFAGKGAFFTEHGYDEIWGKYKWENQGFESANTWGLSDTELFNQAFVKIKSLSQSPQPFNMTLLTLGTHIPGYIYEGCSPYDKTGINNPFIDGIHCTDHLVGAFIKKLDDYGLLENTIVQIQGDHGIFPTHEMKSLFGEPSDTHRIYNATLHPDGKNIGLDSSRPTTSLNFPANILNLLQINHDASFILSSSDFLKKNQPYIMTRYTDFYAGEKFFNAWGETVDCEVDVNEPLKLPLNTCNKQTMMDAIYRLGATYSAQKQDQNVCLLGAQIKIDENTKKATVHWGNLNLSDQFIASGRTFNEPKNGFYFLELDSTDQVINQLFFDYRKPREIKYLTEILKKRDNRYFLFSNLPTATIQKLNIGSLPANFVENKILYAQNQSNQINSLFDKAYMTGHLKFIPESCEGSVQIETYKPNPELNTVKYCDINAWGPKKIDFGSSFNEQPNGDSAFWFQTECAPRGTKVRFNDVMLKTVEKLPSITARIDTEILIPKPGKYSLEFIHPETETVFYIGEFEVLPNASYQAPIPIKPQTSGDNPQNPLLVAHAGGGLDNKAYLNSMEALEQNYALGHRFFELDFNWTADNKLVAIHDWEITYQRLFNTTSDDVPILVEFMSIEMNHEQTQMDLPLLDNWLNNHPDAYIITDIKGKNIEGLKLMLKQMKTAPNQIIPQMYHPTNYQLIKSMGYDHVIFTLYATNLPYYEIVDFVDNNPLFAVTVHPSKKDFNAIAEGVRKTNTFIYVHTYNSVAELVNYRNMGIDGLYTDFLYLDEKGEVQKQ